MTDLRTLTDAFDELARRGDDAAARLSNEVPRRRQSRPMTRLVPVAVAVAVVAGLATGVALLAPGSDTGADSGTQVGAAPTEGSSAAPAPPTSPVPTTPEDLANRFRTVLGDTATFTVTDTGAAVEMTLPPAPDGSTPPAPDGSTPPAPDVAITAVPGATPNGAAIVGLLTASGVDGGYDLQIYQQDPGTKSWCDDPDRSNCTITEAPDGASLAIGRTALEGSSNGVTYQVNLVRADGVTLLMHLSNERDPKGASEVLAPQPPLTTDQMVAILKSDGW